MAMIKGRWIHEREKMPRIGSRRGSGKGERKKGRKEEGGRFEEVHTI